MLVKNPLGNRISHTGSQSQASFVFIEQPLWITD